MFTVLISAALAAPPVAVHAEMPAVPSSVQLYYPVYDAPIVEMEALQDDLGLMGLPVLEDAFGGMRHLVDGRQHLYVYDHGGAAYHNLDALKSNAPIAERRPAEVLADAESLLSSYGLLSVDGVELEPGPVRAHTANTVDAEGVRSEPWATHQAAAFRQRIGGLPGFGGGAWVDVVYGAGQDVALFSHAVRALDGGPVLQTVSPTAAVDRFEARVQEGRFNLIKGRPADTERIEVTGVTLGYYIPDTAMAVTTIVPVYQISGMVVGSGPDGAPMDIPLRWLEPAVDGYGIAELQIPAAR